MKMNFVVEWRNQEDDRWMRIATTDTKKQAIYTAHEKRKEDLARSRIAEVYRVRRLAVPEEA